MSKNNIRLIVALLVFIVVTGVAKNIFAEEVEIVRDYGSESYQYKALEALLEATGVTIDQLPRLESKTKPGQFYFTVPASVAPGSALLNKTVELANKECMAEFPVGITSLTDVSSVSEIDMVEYTKAEFKDLVTALVGNDKPSKYIKEVEQPSIHHYLFASYYGVSIAKVKTGDGASRFVFYSNKTNCLNVVTILNLDEVDPTLLPK